MVLKHWLVSLQQRFRLESRPSLRKGISSRRLTNRSVPAQTEVLEDRTLLTAFVVNTLEDSVAVDGLVSLREAIQSANTNAAVNGDVTMGGEADGDSITFDESIAGGTIILGLGQLTITDDLTIDGADPLATAANITINGNNLFRIFSIDTSTGVGTNMDVALSNLNLDAGNTIGSDGDNGGAILIANGETVTLDSLTITNSTAVGNGGAIFAGNGTLNITNSQIGNDVIDNDFWSNTGATATDDEVFVFVNVATGTPTLDVLNNSGGILAAPLDPVAAGVDVDESGDVFYNVSSVGDPLTDYEIYSSVVDSTSPTSETEVNDFAVSANVITEETLITGISTLADVDFFEITLGADDDRLVVIVDNDPDDDLDATLTLVDILASDGTTVLASGLFPGGVADAAIATGLTGGGTYFVRIRNNGLPIGSYSFVAKSLDGTGDQFDEEEPNNTRDLADALTAAQFGQGDILTGLGGNRAENGGGIFVSGGTLNLDFTSVNNNIATGVNSDLGGGGIYSLGGTVAITNSSSVNFNQASGTLGSGGGILANGGTLTITDSEVIGNTAVRAGGGLETRSSVTAVTATITNSRFEDNVASGVGATAPGNGGGIHVTSLSGSNATSVTITGGNFSGNSAAEEGGGLWNDVTGTMTISGVNIDNNIASGDADNQGGGGVFNNGGTVIIQSNGLTATSISGNIADGLLGSGGGILNDGGTLTVTGATITGNSADRAGGGIEANANTLASVVTLTNVTLSGNVATGEGAAAGNGGGVHVTDAVGGTASTFTISGGSVTGNSAAEEGGGLWNDLGGTMTVNNVTITGNTASGALATQGGGGVFNNGGTVSITGGSISTNVANGTEGSGGGILNDGGTLTVNGTTIDGNSANRAGGGIEATTASSRNSTVTVTNAVITNNDAGPSPGNGGGVHLSDAAGGNTNAFTINGGIVMGNSASEEGGGLWNDVGSTMTINGTFIASNTASGSSANQGGGGIFNNGGSLSIINTLGPTIILSNVANGSAGSGGGILSDGGTLNISGAIILANSANRAGGGIEVNANTTAATSMLTNVTISNNVAASNPGRGGGVHITDDAGGTASTFAITGGSVSGNSASEEGGGLWNDVGGTMTITDVTISGNIASGNTPSHGGGGVFNNGGSVTITGGSVSNNVANGTSGSGGGILNDGGTLTIADATIDGNSAARAGGGIETTTNGGLNSIVTVTNTTISNNDVGTNPGNGGGVHLSDAAGGATSSFTITGGLVTGNSAAAEGGGLWNDVGSTMTINGVSITANTASGNSADQGGGGVFNNGGTLTIQSNMTTATTISGNIANGTSGSGGGILNDGGTLTITGVTISGNSAVRAGGGIEATTANSRDSLITITGSTLTNNTAGNGPGNGGAVHVSDSAGGNASTFVIMESMVTGNIAANEGGGLWNDAGGSMFIVETTISGNTASGALATNGGGGVFNNGGVTGILDSTITSNVANGSLGSGGGVFNDAGGTLNIVGTSITDNTANRAGGGIEDNAGTYTLLANVTLDDNLASGMGGGPGNGGGLHITGAGTVQIIGGTVSGNSAANEGGGLWNSGAGTLLIGSETSTTDDPFIDEATGLDASDIQATVDNFRNALGTLNPNTAGSVNGGRREVNWDGAPDSASAPNSLPGDFFNDGSVAGRARGIEFTTPGTGFQLSATAASMAGIDFSNINANYDDDFASFSPERLFTPIGSNVTVINFFVPGSDTPAVVTGFGAVFSDVDSDTSTLMEFFDKDGNLLASRNVLATAGDETFSFTGVSFTEAVIAQVRITTGTNPLGAMTDDGGTVDLVVMDDFIFGEPVPIAESNTVISGNTASGASASNGGGGIFNDGGILSVVDATISGNTANGSAGNGGGIFNEVGGLIDISRTTISGNVASGSATSSGGGIFNLDTVTIFDSTLSGNLAAGEGGGVWNSGTLQLSQVTLSANTAGADGGGVYTEGTGSTDIRNSTITLNRATMAGGGISIDGTMANVYLESTIVAGNIQGTNTRSDVDGTVLGTSQFNLIGVNTGLMGITNGTNDNLIGTTATPIDALLGPLADNGGPTLTHSLLGGSPAINAGSNPDNLDFDQRGEGFPRVIGGQADIGAVEVQINLTVVGGGPGEDSVNIYNALTGELLASVTPYPGFGGGIRTAVADVNGDNILDVITVTGPGGGPHVKVLSGADNFETELFSFFAFNDPTFFGGVYVAAADFNQDGNADIVVSADSGGGSRVTVYDGSPVPLGTTPPTLQDFFAYGTTFFGGVRIGTGDINDDGIPDIITGAGPGAAPHVRVFDGSLSQFTATPTDILSFFAYDVGFGGGIYVAGGDINGDGVDDIITGAGSSAPHVKVFTGGIDPTPADPPQELLSFFAYDLGFGGGVRVGSTQGPDGDGIADIITGTGPGGGPHVKIFKGGVDATPADPPEVLASFFAFAPTFTGGVFVSGGAVGAGGGDTLLFGGGDIAGEAAALSQDQLDGLVDAAIARLESAGASSAQVEALSTLDIRVSSLADGVLGLSLPGQILIDADASGAGWFIDASPLDDVEFDADLNAQDLAALGRVDLLSVLLHELGHQLGAGDLDVISHPENLMAESLTTGKRRLPNDDLDALFANGDLLGSVLS